MRGCFITCGIFGHDREIIHLYCAISTVTSELDHVVASIIDLLEQLSDGMVHCAHVVHHKDVAIDLQVQKNIV